MKPLLLLAGCLLMRAAAAQVGIGTTSPSANSALDVTSATKGVMLPRLADTAVVRNPSAGLLIYSRQAQAPAYYNGTRWNTLAARTTALGAPVDSVTYTVTGAYTGFTNGVFNASGLGSALSTTYSASSGSGQVTYENVMLRKPADANSTGFIRGVNTGSQAVVATLEIKVFAQGAATPTYSVKLTNPYVVSYRVAVGSGAGLTEEIALSASIIGYKDWASGKSIAWNLGTRMLVPY